jgi:hypothetical protein
MQARPSISPSNQVAAPAFRPDMTSRERDFIERGRVGQVVRSEPELDTTSGELEAVAWFWVMTMLVGLVIGALLVMFRRSQ